MAHNPGMRQTVFTSCLVFIVFLLLLPTNPPAMFGDPDTFWHLAAGDLIRTLGYVPEHTAWSFTADDKQWQNVSWAWDVLLSYFYQHFGWHGVIMMNSVTIAATLSLIFAACFVRSQNGIAAFTIVFFVMVCMLATKVRPYQITHLLTAMLAFLFSQVTRGQCSKRWLLLVPVTMVVWANMHGGFLIAFFLLGMHGIETLYKKNWSLASQLIATGVASLIACLINPYGIRIMAATLQYLRLSDAVDIISEYHSLPISIGFFFADLYIALFVIQAILRPVPTPMSEKWIAYSWLFLCIMAVRNLSVFSIVSAPILAAGLRDYLLHGTKTTPHQSPLAKKLCVSTLRFVNLRIGVGIALAMAVTSAMWMFTAQASQLYDTKTFIPTPDITEEISFLETHYPHARLLNHFNLGGPLIFYTRGKIPVFIDGRGTTAYPDQLYKDYVCFHNTCNDLPQIMDRYAIDSVMFPNVCDKLYDYFLHLHGWKLVFKGPYAMIFVRTT